MRDRDAKAERELAADLHAIADNPRAFLWPMRLRALRSRDLFAYTEEPRPIRLAPGHQRAPAPRAKQLTDKGRLTMALLDRQQAERAAIAGATAARHSTRDGVA